MAVRIGNLQKCDGCGNFIFHQILLEDGNELFCYFCYMKRLPTDIAYICIWRETAEAWETSCGDLFTINDGTPAENNMNYCHKCGKVIAAVPLANEAWARDTMELGE